MMTYSSPNEPLLYECLIVNDINKYNQQATFTRFNTQTSDSFCCEPVKSDIQFNMYLLKTIKKIC